MDIILPYLHLDIFHLEYGPKLAFFDQLPSSPCPRSFWMTLNLKTTHHSNLHKNWFGIFVGLKCYDKILIHFIWSKPIDHAWTDNSTCMYVYQVSSTQHFCLVQGNIDTACWEQTKTSKIYLLGIEIYIIYFCIEIHDLQ